MDLEGFGLPLDNLSFACQLVGYNCQTGATETSCLLWNTAQSVVRGEDYGRYNPVHICSANFAGNCASLKSLSPNPEIIADQLKTTWSLGSEAVYFVTFSLQISSVIQPRSVK
jgi:hypothetical protein